MVPGRVKYLLNFGVFIYLQIEALEKINEDHVQRHGKRVEYDSDESPVDD